MSIDKCILTRKTSYLAETHLLLANNLDWLAVKVLQNCTAQPSQTCRLYKSSMFNWDFAQAKRID